MQIRKCKTKVAQNITVLILLRLFFATDGNFNLDHHFFRMQLFQTFEVFSMDLLHIDFH